MWSAGALDVEAVDAWADANDVECLYFLAPGDDAAAAHAAEGAGFRLMDVRVELARDAASGEPVDGHPRGDGRRPAALRAIASGEPRRDALLRRPELPRRPLRRPLRHLDPAQPRGLGRRACSSPSATARRRGYVSCHLDGGDRLDRADRRRRVGARERPRERALARGASRGAPSAAPTEMTVVTQGRNVAALRTFQRAGFLPSSLDLWFHKWYVR